MRELSQNFANTQSRFFPLLRYPHDKSLDFGFGAAQNPCFLYQFFCGTQHIHSFSGARINDWGLEIQPPPLASRQSQLGVA